LTFVAIGVEKESETEGNLANPTKIGKRTNGCFDLLETELTRQKNKQASERGRVQFRSITAGGKEFVRRLPTVTKFDETSSGAELGRDVLRGGRECFEI